MVTHISLVHRTDKILLCVCMCVIGCVFFSPMWCTIWTYLSVVVPLLGIVQLNRSTWLAHLAGLKFPFDPEQYTYTVNDAPPPSIYLSIFPTVICESVFPSPPISPPSLSCPVGTSCPRYLPQCAVCHWRSLSPATTSLCPCLRNWASFDSSLNWWAREPLTFTNHMQMIRLKLGYRAVLKGLFIT